MADSGSGPRKPVPIFTRDRLIIWGVMAIAMFAWAYYQRTQEEAARRKPAPILEQILGDRPTPTASRPEAKPTTTATARTTKATAPAASSPTLVRNVVIRDEDNDVIYRGDMELRPTIDRIRAGRKLSFPNDGTTFQNRERRLPQKPPGYYREWVVPTPGERGPGPQRIVTGAEGEVWYTKDHYRSFSRIAVKVDTPAGAGSR